MTRRMLSFVLLAVIASAPVVASAQVVVYDPYNYVEAQINHAEQIVQTSKMVQGLEHDLQMIQTLQEQYAVAKQGVEALPEALLARQRSDLAELQSLVSNEHQLMAQSATYDQTFNRLYPGYAPGNDFGQTYMQLQKNTQTAAKPLEAVITATLKAQPHFQRQSAANQATIKNANASKSQIAATIAGANLAEQTVEQLQKLQTLDALRGQMEINYYMEAQADHAQAQKTAQTQNLMNTAMYEWTQDVCPTGATCPGVPHP